MSNKTTKKLSQILFRRSNVTKSGPLKRSASMIKEGFSYSPCLAVSQNDPDPVVLISRKTTGEFHIDASMSSELHKHQENSFRMTKCEFYPALILNEAKVISHRSKLKRRHSNGNYNPLREVSWSCPTLEKRREMIMNYFETPSTSEINHNNERNFAKTRKRLSLEDSSLDLVIPSSVTQSSTNERRREPIYEEITRDIRDKYGNFDDKLSETANKREGVLANILVASEEVTTPLYCSTYDNVRIYENVPVRENSIVRDDLRVTGEEEGPVGEREEHMYTTLDPVLRHVPRKNDINVEEPEKIMKEHELIIVPLPMGQKNDWGAGIVGGSASGESESGTVVACPRGFPASSPFLHFCEPEDEPELPEVEADYGLLAKTHSASVSHSINTDSLVTLSVASSDSYLSHARHHCSVNIHESTQKVKIATVEEGISIDLADLFPPFVISVEDAALFEPYSSDSLEDEDMEDPLLDIDSLPPPPKEFTTDVSDVCEEDVQESTVDLQNSSEFNIEWGEVNSDSIIENKAATKFYWEKRMRTSGSAGDIVSVTMSSSVSQGNRFLSHNSNTLGRVENKYLDDMDEDGGFESFQVVDEDDDVSRSSFSPTTSDAVGENVIETGMKVQSRPLTFSQSQEGVSTKELQAKATTVLDRINAEISNLHLREMELKNTTSVTQESDKIAQGDEESSNSDGVGETASEDDYSDSAIDFESYTATSNSGNATPSNSSRAGSNSPNADEQKPDSDDFIASKTSGRVRPLVEEDEDVKSVPFKVAVETPIEREIRLTREREEEFRKEKHLNQGDDGSKISDGTNKEPRALTLTAVAAPRKLNHNKNFQVFAANEKEGSNSNKNLQYELATARLKREIEENLQREDELKRLKSLSSSISLDEASEGHVQSNGMQSETDDHETHNNVESSTDGNKDDENEYRNILPSAGKKPKERFQTAPSFQKNTTNASLSPKSVNTTASLQLNEENSEQKATGYTAKKTPTTSMDRYLLLMRTSSKFTIGSRLQVKAPMIQEIKHTESVEEKPAEIPAQIDDEEELEPKPRRKYIRAQDKIEMELMEMRQREEELYQQRAKWKSTPDLYVDERRDRQSSILSSEDSEDVFHEEPEEVEEPQTLAFPNKPSLIRGKKGSFDDGNLVNIPKKTTIRRRQSALITQWEELIKQKLQKT